MKKYVVLTMVLGVAGCDQISLPGKGLMCSNPDGIKVVRELITEEAEKGLRAEKRPDGSQLFESSRIRAAIPLFTTTFGDFRTTKEGSNKDKAVCEARIKYVIPTEILSRTEEGLTALSIASLSTLADSNGFDQEANAFIKDISYTLQYTDDRQSIYASLQASDPFVDLLTSLTGAYLVQPLVVENKNRALSAAEAVRLSEEQAVLDEAKLSASAAGDAAAAAGGAADAPASRIPSTFEGDAYERDAADAAQDAAASADQAADAAEQAAAAAEKAASGR